MTAGDDGPIGSEERDALLAPLASFPVIVLAVSGGPDSMALLHMAHGWSRGRPGPAGWLVAVTVDHGLRPEAAAEAAMVATHARDLGIEHHTVGWTGPAPATGLQAAARTARYRLLSGVARQKAAVMGGPAVIVTAHTADDQAETLIMRLARGSGVDGLASIFPRGVAPAGRLPGDAESCAVLRPLLGIPRRRLLATLAASAVPFADDPSNRDRRFERVRVREVLDALETLGVTREALQRSARRLQSAREALERAADDLEARAVRSTSGLVHEIDAQALSIAPQETGIRVLRRVLARAGGAASAADLGAVEAAFVRLMGASGVMPAFTLGGCIVEIAGGEGTTPERVRIYREPDRTGGLGIVEVAPGASARWDERFQAEVDEGYAHSVEVGPLSDDWGPLVAEHPGLARLALPRPAARGCPAFRRAGELLAVPPLADLLERIGETEAAHRLAGPMGRQADGAEARLLRLRPLRLCEPDEPPAVGAENDP